MITLDNRLAAAAELCREGRIAADVGCDHALLACYLARNKSRLVIASDVRDGPLEAARKTVAEQGVTNVKVVKSDGLHEVEFADDVIICGMGGELITEIIGGCRFLSDDTRFILQPMTKANYLRCWLCENGYEIVEERAAYDDQRIYTIIYVKYTGERREPDEIFALCGKMTDSGYLRKTAEKLLKQAEGMSVSGNLGGEVEKIREIAAVILKRAGEYE
ncbi:MAG: class I SAM-dependent methyltransferase [Oscillospiraceae bacterium]|nr:class I SAM-dependent methyltransferase [Oscillospiraceae bacterium]